MTEWERERERAEFEQAARLYRPLSAAFSDRFVSASRPDDATNPLAPVMRTATADDGPVAAARLKMYGHLTRRVTEWQPHNMLCKRFNIPKPRVNDSSKPKPTRPKFSVFNFLDAAPLNHMPAAAGVDDGPVDIPITSQTGEHTDHAPEAEPQARNPVSSLSSVDQKPEDNEIKTSNDAQMDELEQRTNKLDLYKAIFLSSSEESDNDDNETEVKNLPIQKQSASELNVLRNTSPPRGIFANLNFDAFNSKEIKLHVASNNKSSETTLNNSSQTTSLRNEDNSKRNIVDTHIIEAPATSASNEKEASSQNTNLSEVYGPTLPKQISKVNVVTIDESSSSGSEDEWVELKDSTDKVSKKHSPNKQKSKRKTKEKRKKKKKKHKRRKKEY